MKQPHGKIYKIFDRLEDHIRRALSHHPLIYTFIGGIGIVLFWRGIWHIADHTPILENEWVSLLVSVIILMGSGLFVSFFIGDDIIISGLRGEKRLIERSAEDIEKELDKDKFNSQQIEEHVRNIEKSLSQLKEDLDNNKAEIL